MGGADEPVKLVAQTVREIYSSKVVGGVIFAPFSNVDNFLPEVYSDVVSGGRVVDPTGVKVHVKFGDYTSNLS